MSHQEPTKQNDDLKYNMRDMVADSTSVSWVDGINGRLFYRGINIAELAAHATFEETAWLLLTGKLPTKSRLDSFQWGLSNMSHSQEKVIRIIEEFPQYSNPLLVLQTCLASLACIDREDEYLEEENYIEKVMRIISQTPVILSAAYRHYLGVPLLEPRSDLSFVENFIYMLFGKIPTKNQTRCMEIALIIQMDHGFNPSTFTARTVASTLANFYSATSAAVGALSGSLHGGASVLTLEMLEKAKQSENVSLFVQNLLHSGGKIMGMGHRVYKTVDPRAIIFKDLLTQLTAKEEKTSDLKILNQIEEEARKYFKEKMLPIFVNVDFWSGSVYKKLGIHPVLYSAIFAAARMVGWCSHILELRQNNRVYSPLSNYNGETNIPYIPIEQR
ncbi:citrate/2-methylcitrate synthase [Pigmentibacter sp. JX0631]|uniref:citrate/2-methylcitrate synthase n=1 Tax=Pigmentibacter sp. JX0631 TaxID=2976982 RepID=UPI0024698B12|nr:citrate/2-methylcitrate synthase [Pigmentibacter sp. JX0631]WGL61401.1 citrate/2-methylcitrate synthase [Pigmentibacter sp. JX0631]